jgi:hypothetical protein
MKIMMCKIIKKAEITACHPGFRNHENKNITFLRKSLSRSWIPRWLP